MKYFLGCDPGKDGALVRIDEDLNICEFLIMPTIQVGKKGNKRQFNPPELLKWLRPWPHITYAVTEKSQAYPKQGSTSNHSTGLGDMMCWMALEALGVRYLRIPPQQWQKIMLAGIPGDNPKGRALIAAQRLFPGENFLATDRCRIAHDGLVDAALMAGYAAKIYRVEL